MNHGNNLNATTGRYPIPYAQEGTLKPLQYAKWMLQLKAAMSATGCAAAFSATAETDLNTASEAANVSIAQIAALKRNTNAVGICTIAFSTNNGLLAMVHASINNDWPGGRAWVIYQRVTAKYEKDNMVGETQREKMLDAITMKRNEDPQEMLGHIAACNMVFARTGNTLDDKDMILQAHKKLPLDLYASAITAAQMKWEITNANQQMTFSFFEAKIAKHYEMLKEAAEHRSAELTLARDGGDPRWQRGRRGRGGRGG